MSLSEKIASLRTEIRTDGYPMSIGEWASLYESGELDIHPEFQRFFRWSETQRTALIESILLGIPVPSVFVSQRADGIWDVVDGLQRLSTIFQFLGILRDENGEKVPPLCLRATKYLPEIEGVTWEKDNPLPQDLKLIFKRTKINVSIILRESDENTKYDLFQRLNTGGSQASDQEVRNCIMVMLDRSLYKWMHDLASNDAFRRTISLSERPLFEAYDIELVLRFLILFDIPEDELKSVGDVGVFLTDRMRNMATTHPIDRDAVEPIFHRTFELIDDTLADNAFKRFSIEKDRYMGAFQISQFEVVACGIGHSLNSKADPGDIDSKVRALWSNNEYTDWTGSGITAARRLPRLIPLGRKVFS